MQLLTSIKKTVSLPRTVNNKDLHKQFQCVATDMLGAKTIIEPRPRMGSEAFSLFAEGIPGYYFLLGMQNETRRRLKSVHFPYFMLNEDVLPYGAALHASLATRYLLEYQPKPISPKENFHDEL
ncbi:hypothetical protein F0562_009635 [Nyssa sinensis]|uniref:Peptidase M20 dimerisation domain-containing protein n=1 Tax=Nyssa sinensis TaxID=561372 RepID=A0A5J5A0G5_9ASTE|nr:hypothetical protein F0562_009635 [Nyssa sinensis]